MTGGQVVQHRHVPAGDVPATPPCGCRCTRRLHRREQTSWITPVASRRHSAGCRMRFLRMRGAEVIDGRTEARDAFVYGLVTSPLRTQTNTGVPYPERCAWTRTPILSHESTDRRVERPSVMHRSGAGKRCWRIRLRRARLTILIRVGSSISRSRPLPSSLGFCLAAPAADLLQTRRKPSHRVHRGAAGGQFFRCRRRRGCRLRSRNQTSSGSCRFFLPRWPASRISAAGGIGVDADCAAGSPVAERPIQATRCNGSIRR